MDEGKEDRGGHLIGAFRNFQNKLSNFYYYSSYAACIDWAAMSVTLFFNLTLSPLISKFIPLIEK